MPLREDLLQPIPGANPGGVNLRYDPLYDRIKEARREEEDVDQGDWKRARKVADWPLVIKLATEALTTKSKDLQLAAWLTEALLRQEALGGLQAGMVVLHGLLERYWDTLHPGLENGNAELRAAPLTWVGRYLDIAVKSVPVTTNGLSFYKYAESRTVPAEAATANDEKKQAARQAAVGEGKLTPEEFEKAFDLTPKAWYKQLVADLGANAAAVQALDELGQQRFGEAAPSFTKLQEAIEEVRHVAAQLLDKKLQMDPEPVDSKPMDTPGVRSVGTSPATLSVEPTSIDDAAARIGSAARYLRHSNPRNPASYLMLRGFRWGELRAGGSSLDPKQLSAPPTQVRTHLKGLLLDGKWADLLDDGENVMASAHGRGWLDLQRYELTACEMLGAEYEHVAAALRGALVALLRDLPQLREATLMDDTPTANAETRTWLQDAGLVAAAAQAAEEERAARSGVMATATARPRASGAAFARAIEEVRAGRPQKGIELLMREAEQEKSPRARFLRRSEAASIMVDGGLESVALPILRELLEQIEVHKLDDWEAGNLVAQPMGLLYRCLQKLGGDGATKDDLYRRICRLDPLQAMAFPAPTTTDGAS